MSSALSFARSTMIACASLALLVAASATALADDKPASTSSSDKFEGMLKDAGFFYQRLETPGQPPQFKILFQDSQNRSTTMLFRVIPGSWKFNDGTPADMLYGLAPVLAQAKLPAAVAVKVGELNANQVFSFASYETDEGIFCYTGAFMRNLEIETAAAYIVGLHYTAIDFKGAVDAVVKAANSEN